MSASSVPVLKTSFQIVSSKDSNPPVKKEKKKRPAPLSVRISASERISLEEAASGLPINRYVRGCLFDAGGNIRQRRGKAQVQDPQAIARILSALGQTEIFRNLDALVAHIENGNLQLSTEIGRASCRERVLRLV